MCLPSPSCFPAPSRASCGLMTSEKTPHVDMVGVGLNATDTIIQLPHFPAFNSKVEFASSMVLPGGQSATACVACSTWGLRARYIGTVGDDAAADFQRREFKRAGVEACLVAVPDCASQAAFILVDGNTGERTILWRRDLRLTLQPEQLQREQIVSAKALHIDGHDAGAATLAARWGKEAGLVVVADVDNLYPGIDGVLDHVGHLIASEGFPAKLTGERSLLTSLPAIARRHGCRVAGATLGRNGVLAWDSSRERFLYAPAYRLAARDTTGAGDVFHAAMIYGLLAKWPLSRVLDFSCAGAGLNCMALGARGGIRPVAEIEALMRTGARHEPLADFAQYNIGRTLE